MHERVVRIDSDRIEDWNSFHSVFASSLGFPASYGRNMDAWVDRLTYIDEGDGLSDIVLEADEVLVLRIENASRRSAGPMRGPRQRTARGAQTRDGARPVPLTTVRAQAA